MHRGFSPTKNLFAPRLGFAYDVLGDGKMALRAGFGIFHERLRQNNFNFGAGGQWPNLTSASPLNGNVANIDTSVTAAPAPQITPPGLDDLAIRQYHAQHLLLVPGPSEGTSREVLGGPVLRRQPCRAPDGAAEAECRAGEHVRPVSEPVAIRQLQERRPPSVLWLGQPDRGRDPRLFLLQRDDVPRSAAGSPTTWPFNFNYTWSKVMDLVDNDSDTIINPFNIRQNWAAAGYDQTNVFSTDFVYMLPKVKGALDRTGLRTILERMGSQRHAPRPVGHAVLGHVQRIDPWAWTPAASTRTSSATPMPDRTNTCGSTPPPSSAR